MVTAIAMVIDVPVQELIEEINKPYKDVIHFGAQGSMKFRGHHPQDFTKYLQDKGWALVINYGRWPAIHFHSSKCLLCGGSGKFKGRWEEGDLLTEGNVGLLQYQNHFCAWDGNKVYNPSNGEISDFYTTRLSGFHPMYRICKDVSNRQASD
jgi:hypothetical protein